MNAIIGHVVSALWWGGVVMFGARCLEQGLTNIGIAIANSTSAVIKAALQAKESGK